MLQILLSLIVLVAALILLASSRQSERRLFTATALVVSVTAAAIFAGLVYQMVTPPATLDSAQLRVTLEGAHPTETGVRLNGRLHNDSDQRVAAVRLRIEASDCSQDPCQALASDTLDVLLQIPPGRSYPFSAVARITGLRGRDNLHWTLSVVRVTTY